MIHSNPPLITTEAAVIAGKRSKLRPPGCFHTAARFALNQRLTPPEN
jgi:hypothetical protein